MEGNWETPRSARRGGVFTLTVKDCGHRLDFGRDLPNHPPVPRLSWKLESLAASTVWVGFGTSGAPSSRTED